jgi:hypothetical protein
MVALKFSIRVNHDNILHRQQPPKHAVSDAAECIQER